MTSNEVVRPNASIAVFICSSDSRRDVLDRVLLSILKFWPDCPYPLYIGLNTRNRPLPTGTPVLADPSEWCRECALQLSQLTEDYLIVMLDDFLFRAQVDQTRLSELVKSATTLNLAYLRLMPLGRSLLARLTGKHPPDLESGLERISAGHPFYSGLQIAIWRKDHLQLLLQKPQSIWDFERGCPPGLVHCAIKDAPPVVYSQLVERGLWLPYASSLLRRAGLPSELGERPAWPKSRYVNLFWDQVRWAVQGYAKW